MEDDAAQDRKRLKEREKKAAQRARRPKPVAPPQPSDDFIELAFAERDFRLNREYAMWRHPDLPTYAYRWAHLIFSADVWVAQVVLEKQYGRRCTSPTRIVNWLVERGLTHGCTNASLRTMVYRAFEKVKRLESETYLFDRREVVWPPFSLAEAAARSATTLEEAGSVSSVCKSVVV